MFYLISFSRLRVCARAYILNYVEKCAKSIQSNECVFLIIQIELVEHTKHLEVERPEWCA